MRKDIQEFIEKEKEKNRQWDERMTVAMAEHIKNEARKRNELLPCMRNAKISEYILWLSGFLDRGGKVTNYYDYSFNQKGYAVFLLVGGKAVNVWVSARKDFTLFPLFGPQAVNIVVPVGVKVTCEGIGHSNMFFMEDYSNQGGWIPVFCDTLV